MSTDKLRCMIVDDDPSAVLVLENHIRNTEFLEHIISCTSAVEAIQFLTKEAVEIIFLDVEMPEMSGLEMVEHLSSRPEIILVTGKEDYAVEAFELEVLDYIVKPVNYARFLKSAKRVQEKFSARREMSAEKNQLYVKADGRLVPVEFDKILYVEAKADYVTIHTEEKRLTIYSTMKGIESKLPEDRFLRIHRSFIINTKRISSIEDNVVVLGEKLIPVGVTYKDKLIERLNLL